MPCLKHQLCHKYVVQEPSCSVWALGWFLHAVTVNLVPVSPWPSQSLVGSQELISFVISLLPIRTQGSHGSKAAWSGGRRRARQRHWVFCELMTIFQVTFNGFPFQVLVQSPSELVKSTSVLCILLQGAPQPCSSAAVLHGVTCPNPNACSSTENGQLSVWNGFHGVFFLYP